MAETRIIRLVTANGGIPHSMKTYRTINVSHSGQDSPNTKVIRVALPQQFIQGRSSQDKIPDISSLRSDEDTDGALLSKNALLARENRLKKKRYINGLEENLSVAKKENQSLTEQLKEKDDTIEKLQKEVEYFKSILANVQEISSLINTIKQTSPIPISTSLSYPPHSMKRAATSELSAYPINKRIKMEKFSESSSGTTSVFNDDDCDDWMPSSPTCTTQLDAESYDVLSNFSEEDFNLFGDEKLLPESSHQISPFQAGVCLHVFNKKMSLEFCVACAAKAQDKWKSEI